MSLLFRSRQRADEFAALVDRTPRAVRPLSEHVDDRVEHLVGVAGSLRTFAGSPEQQTSTAPRDEFVIELRERLLAEAAVVLTSENAALRLPERRRGTRERRLVAAATAAVLLGGTAGVAVAAQDALPGEALYPLKRGMEQAQASLAPTDAGKGRDLLGAASDRLDEVQGLLAQRSATGAPQVPATLDTFSQQAREGSDLLLASYRGDRDPASVAAVREFAANGLGALQTMSESAPPDARDEIRDAAITLRDIDRRATALCASCSDLPVLQVPTLLLASADAERALTALGADAAAKLDNSHPVVVPKEALHQVSGGSSSGTGASTSDGSGSDSGAGTASGGDSTAPDSSTSTDPAPSEPQATGTPTAPLKVKAKVRVGDKELDADIDLGKTVETLLPDPDVLP